MNTRSIKGMIMLHTFRSRIPHCIYIIKMFQTAKKLILHPNSYMQKIKFLTKLFLMILYPE